MSSFRNERPRWVSTVFSVTNKVWAISRFVLPPAASSATLSSLGVSASAPERSVVKLASVHTQKLPDLDSAPRTDARPVATYAPVQNDGVLGLMSGRGLY